VEAKLTTQDEIDRVEEILNRLAPRIQSWLVQLLEKDGNTVTLSVAANIGTSLVSTCLLMVAQKGGSVEDFLNAMVYDTQNKFQLASQELVAQKKSLHDDIVSSGWGTCRPLH
jgi:hypothetical protein